VYRAVLRRDVVVFLYHLIGPPDIPHVRHLYPYKSSEEFEADLDDLERRFRLVSYEEIDEGRRRPGRPAAHLTFDDGYAECDTLARPILARRGIPCSFFVTTGLIDNRVLFHRNKASLCVEAAGRLSGTEVAALLRDLGRVSGRPLEDRDEFDRWALSRGPEDEACLDAVAAKLELDFAAYLRERRPYLEAGQIRRLADGGFTIGAHAVRHVPLGALPRDEAEKEILMSCRAVRDLTGRPRVPFAFPHSADGVDRRWLRGLLDGRAEVGRLFDTHGLRADDVLCSRIIVDRPPARPGASDLPMVLRAAYQEAAVEALRRLTIGPFGGRRAEAGSPGDRP